MARTRKARHSNTIVESGTEALILGKDEPEWLKQPVVDMWDLATRRAGFIRAKVRECNQGLSRIRDDLGYHAYDKGSKEAKKIEKLAHAARSAILSWLPHLEGGTHRNRSTSLSDLLTSEHAKKLKGVPQELLEMFDPLRILLLYGTFFSSERAHEQAAKELEKDLGKVAKQLPIIEWVDSVRGFTPHRLGIIVGTTKSPGRYEKVSQFWKYLGIGVVNYPTGDARRQGHPLYGTDKDWIDHGFVKDRRAVAWVAGEHLIRGQWGHPEGEGKGNPCCVLGPYGAYYIRAKARGVPKILATLDEPRTVPIKKKGEDKDVRNPKKWTRNRVEQDARRKATKALLKDLWRNWTRMGRGEPFLYREQCELTSEEEQALITYAELKDADAGSNDATVDAVESLDEVA